MRLAVPLLLLSLASCTTLPPRGRLAMRDVQFPVRDLRYASGLRVLVEQDSRRPVVAVVSLVGSGGASDPKGKEGLAHLVEHLTFRARSAERPSRWGQLEAAGAGQLNAFTSFDTTVYHEMAPRESLSELLRIEGERLAAPLQGVTPEIFDVEREVVRNELRQHNETGFVGQVFSFVQQASFPEGHPYARPIIGGHESLSALTLADAQSFVRNHYRPENTTLVIIGDVDPLTVDQLIARHVPARLLGSGLMSIALDKRLPEAPPAVPLNPRAEPIEHEAAVPTPELYLSWTLPRGYDDASFLQDFVERTLPGELYRALQHDGDIAGLSTSLIPGKHASLLVVRVMLRSGEHPKKSAETVLDQLFHLWEGQVEAGNLLATQAQVQRQRLSVFAGMALEADDLLDRALRRAELTHFTLDPRAYTRSLAAVAQVDSSRVTRFAYEYMQRARARMVMVWPTTGGAAEATAGRAAPLSVEEDVPANGPLTQPPSVAGFRTIRLENGLEVVLGSTPGMPLATVAVWLHGGSATSEPLGVAELADDLVFPDSTFQGSASDYGLRQRSSVHTDHASFSFSGAAGNLPNMLAMTAEQLSSLKTSDEFVRYYREQIIPYIEKAEARPEYKAARAFRAALYPRHPHGRVPLAANLQAVGKREIEAWVERTYRPANAVVAIVGELDLDEAEKQARTWLSGWSGSKGEVSPPPTPEAGPARPVQVLMTARPGATQTQVSWGCPLPRGDAAAEARYDLMAELASTRLYRQVRSSLGASYGFSGWSRVYEGGAAHLEIHGALENAQLTQALAAVRQTLGELSEGHWQPVELEAARRRLHQRYSLSLGTSRALAQAVLNARGRGWPLAEVEDFSKHLAAVSPAKLQDDFAVCTGHLVVSLLGDEAVTRGAADALSDLKGR
ncbi:pitrilysin family protein [Archangium sp.]|uniref:M16 family metallopeptidase n=1 Tax=Archangium sp. TaxID=1872627 RepID=UPI002D710781|nr:pitrilysin family protein [Archangium sp.]HYO55861.1 pitrilysin family protein [Archangium sp.]